MWSRVSWCCTRCYSSFGRWALGVYKLYIHDSTWFKHTLWVNCCSIVWPQAVSDTIYSNWCSEVVKSTIVLAIMTKVMNFKTDNQPLGVELVALAPWRNGWRPSDLVDGSIMIGFYPKEALNWWPCHDMTSIRHRITKPLTALGTPSPSTLTT